jgi:hypothetical protein
MNYLTGVEGANIVVILTNDSTKDPCDFVWSRGSQLGMCFAKGAIGNTWRQF